MKTKEIDIWIEEIDIPKLAAIPDKALINNFIKAKLIIEVPEPKIEITPSRLIEKYWECCEVNDPFEITIVKLERALFGEIE